MNSFFGNKKDKDDNPKTPLHTSCSAPLIAGSTSGTLVDGGITHTLLVVDFEGTDPNDPDCMPAVVGGSGFVIDKTALLLATAQTNALWLIPVIASAIVIGIVIARKF